MHQRAAQQNGVTQVRADQQRRKTSRCEFDHGVRHSQSCSAGNDFCRTTSSIRGEKLFRRRQNNSATHGTRMIDGVVRSILKFVIPTVYFIASREGFSTASAQLIWTKKDAPTDGVANPRIYGSQAEPPSRLIRGIATPSVGIIRI